MQPYVPSQTKGSSNMPRFEKSVFDMKYTDKKDPFAKGRGGKNRSPSPVDQEMLALRERERSNIHQIQEYPENFPIAHSNLMTLRQQHP